MRLFGYARVLTSQKFLDIQIKTLEKAGVAKSRIFTDTAVTFDTRISGIELLKTKVKEGDRILIKKLSCLGRDTAEMVSLINQFNKRGVIIRFLDDKISTKDSMEEMIVPIFCGLYRAERQRRIELENEGRIEAKSKGLKLGRKRSVDREKVLSLIEKGESAINIAKRLKIARASVYRVLNEKLEL